MEKEQGSQSAGGHRLIKSDCHAPDTDSPRDKVGVSGQDNWQKRKSGESYNSVEEQDRWQEHWYEVATRFCGIFNGFSYFLDRIGGLNGKVKERITGQDLPNLWNGIQSESFQWCSGRFNEVSFKENLFTVLWKYFAQSYRQDNLPFESEEVQTAWLHNVWIGGKPRRSSQGWEYQEQYNQEHSDHLSQLSYEIALETKELSNRYSGGRVDRLKSLGNAIVPQVVMVIMQAIKEVETR
jgi:hypothetical protein